MHFQKEISQAKQDNAEATFIPRVHHILMKTYGWISLEEFKKIPIPTLFSLLEMIDEDAKAEKKEYDKMRKQ